MGQLFKNARWWWDYIAEELFCHHDSIRGSITVCHGFLETEIKLNRRINIDKVYVSIQGENPPVCSGNVDMIGAVKKNHHTFILYTDIKSNSATVHWLAEYHHK